jgi:lipoate-protein ligase A
MNMALDEVLLRTASAPTLRRTVGSGLPSRSAISGGTRRWSDCGLSGIRSGAGLRRIVPHGEDFTYTIVVPRSDPFAALTASESYRLLHEPLVRLLARGNALASLALSVAPKLSNACFENPLCTMCCGTEKVAGAAQRRTSCGLLHQGSVQSAEVRAELGRKLPAELAQCDQSRVEGGTDPSRRGTG